MHEFTHYYEEHKKSVFTYLLYRLSFDRATAEDLTSEVFIKAFEHFDSYDRNRSFKTWIFTIAHNHLINFFTSKKKTLPLDEAREVSSNEKYTESQEFDTRMALEQLKKFVHRLPESQRELVIMRYVNDLSYGEIAAITHTKEGAIRTALCRAIATLRDMYNQHLSPHHQ